MKLFKDSKKQLNLHPLVVYFLLTSKEKATYGQRIEELNDRPAFNCGIFQFTIMTRTRHNSSELSEKLTQELDDCNIMVRLFDNAKKDDFCYAFQQIPFGLDNERLEWEIQSFIIEVCKQNVKRLSGTLKSDHSISPERKIASESLARTMKEAIKKLSPIISKFREQYSTQEDSNDLPEAWVEDYLLIMSQLQGKKAKDAMSRFMAIVEGVYDTASVEDSTKISDGALNNQKDDILRDDIASRQIGDTTLKSKTGPDITVEVKKITTSKTKTGKEKKNYGVEFTINGNKTQVYFGGTDATMIYLSSLIKQMAGSRFYRKYMLLPLPEKNSLIKRSVVVNWLEALYKNIYPGAEIAFDEWYRKMRKDPHIISQGKSTCARKVANELSKKGEILSIPLCVLQAREDEEGLYYALDLPSTANIILPPNLEVFLSEEVSVPRDHARPETEYHP